MKFLKKKAVWISLAILILAVWGGFKLFGSSGEEYETTTVQRGDISQEVSVTGRVQASESVDLAFEKNGRLVKVNVKVGDQVKAGQALAGLSNADLAAQVNQAQASYEKAKAEYDSLLAGTRPEELQIARTEVANAQKNFSDAKINLENVKEKAVVDLDNYYDDVSDVLNDAYSKADDALNKQTDDMFFNDSSSFPTLTFSVSNYSVKDDVESKRKKAGHELASLKTEIDNLPTTESGLDGAMVNAETHLDSILFFLARVSDALNIATDLSSATLADYKYYLNTGRTNINTVLTSISTQKQYIATQKATNQSAIATAEASVNTAQNSLASAQDELALKEAGATAQELAASAAQVKYAAANVESYRAELAKTIISSPFDGMVTKQDAKIGQMVSMNAPLISVMGKAQFEIEANVAEADIAKIAIADLARVTLDTFGNDVVFAARIVKIDPAETILEGVATYKTTLQFEKEDGRIKSGMTANIDIVSAELKNVLILSQRVVVQENGSRYVFVSDENNQPQKKNVVVGLKGASGNVEILSGLAEGEKVFISPDKILP